MNSKTDEDDIAYLSVLKLSWILKSEKLINLIDKSLKTCRSAGIRSLLLSKKLSATRAIKDYEQNEETYLSILKEFKKTPESVRNIVAKPVFSNNIFRHDAQLKKFRSWEESLFEENWKKVFGFTRNRLQRMLLTGVMILPAELYRSVYTEDLKSFANDNPEITDIFTMSQRETDALYNFLSQDEDNIQFFNRCAAFELSEPEEIFPFYKARLDLVNTLFEAIGEDGILHLFNLYSSVRSVEDVERLNIYFRQYMRYASTNWRFDVTEVLAERKSDPDYAKIAAFCQKVNLSELFGYLCTWTFEIEKRERLLVLLLEKVV